MNDWMDEYEVKFESENEWMDGCIVIPDEVVSPHTVDVTIRLVPLHYSMAKEDKRHIELSLSTLVGSLKHKSGGH